MRRLLPVAAIALLASLVSGCASDPSASPVTSGSASPTHSESASPAERVVTGHVTSEKGHVTLDIPEDWVYDETLRDSFVGESSDDPTDFVGSWAFTVGPGTEPSIIVMTLNQSDVRGGDLLETWTTSLPADPDDSGWSIALLEQGTFPSSSGYETAFVVLRLDSLDPVLYEAIFALGTEEALLEVYLFSTEQPTGEAIALIEGVLKTVVITGAP